MTNPEPAAAPSLAPHQVDALKRLEAILAVRRGAILADAPGLGKTWVAAGLAAKVGVRTEVVVPSHLRNQWREVLSAFGVDASVVSHESLAKENIALGEPGRLLIVDEAHRFRNPSTRRYQGLARRSLCARTLLVTATPICNEPRDLLALLELIVSDDELSSCGVPSVLECFTRSDRGVTTVLRELVVRRSETSLKVALGIRRDVVIRYDPAAGLEAMSKAIERLKFPWVQSCVHGDLLHALLFRRLESSVVALLATVRRMKRVCRRARTLADRGVWLPATSLRTALGDPDSGFFQDILFPELWGARVDDSMAHTIPTDRDFDEEIRTLDAIERAPGPDLKVNIIVDIVRERKGCPGIVFTVSCDTAESLHSVLSEHARCAMITGRTCLIGGKRCGPDTVLGAMNREEVDVLIATDVGGEGHNLQIAGYVVHYDQPWNPAVIDQRNGRICRIGQQRDEVESIMLVPVSSRTCRVVERKQDVNAEFWRRNDEVMLPDGTSDAWRPPPRLEVRRIQTRVVEQLRRRGLARRGLIDLLSTRNRAGVERLMELVAVDLDRERADLLLKVLSIEREMISSCSSAL